MQISPRYDGPPVLSIDAVVSDPGRAVTRQRRRMEAMLVDLTPEQWATPSRCDAWTVRDVVAHLVTVNRFWDASLRAGVAGDPTRLLAGFDPEAHPRAFVESMGPLSGTEVLEQFVASNDAFLAAVAALTEDQWQLPAECPAGHLPIARVVDHGLWDSWIHERDIAHPLGLAVDDEDDEIAASLRYAAALGPALGAGQPNTFMGVLAVVSDEPTGAFVVEAGDVVAVREGTSDAGVPCLRGSGAALVEALSLRAPLPAGAPPEWHLMTGALSRAFAAA